MKFALIFLFISNIYCDIDLTKNFLQNFEIQINSIFIFKVNYSEYSDQIINSLTLPKLVLQDDLEINFFKLSQI